MVIDTKEQKQKVSSPLFLALQGKPYQKLYCIIVFVFFFFFFCTSYSRLLPYSPSSTTSLYIRFRAWRSSSIVGLIVEDLWYVSFLTTRRTGFVSSSTPSLLFSLNLADLYTRSRYHFFVSISSICFLATLLNIIFWVQTEDFIFLYGTQDFTPQKNSLFFSIWVLQI